MNENPKNDGSGGGPPDSLLEKILGRGKKLSRSRLLPLSTRAGPMGEVLAGRSSLTGELAWFDAGRSAPLAFVLEHRGTDPPTACLEVPSWPDDWDALAVFLAEFEFWQFQAPTARFSLGEAIPPMPGRGDTDVPAAQQPCSLAADDRQELVADDGQEAADPVISGASSEVRFSYFADDGTLEITGKLPEDSDGETVVAELRTGSGSGAQTVRRAVHLDHPLPDGRYKANTFSFFPAAEHGDVELVVRPLTEEDLALLEPHAVQALLGRQEYISMPAEASDDGFVFRARWPDQQELAAGASTCWALSVAIGEEG